MSNAKQILAAALVGASTLSGAELAAKEFDASSVDTHAAHAWAMEMQENTIEPVTQGPAASRVEVQMANARTGTGEIGAATLPDVYDWTDPQRERYADKAQRRLEQSWNRLKPAGVEICIEETGANHAECTRTLDNVELITYPLSKIPYEKGLERGLMIAGHYKNKDGSQVGGDARFINETSTDTFDLVVGHEMAHVIQTVRGARVHCEVENHKRMTEGQKNHPVHRWMFHDIEANADMLGGRIARSTGMVDTSSNMRKALDMMNDIAREDLKILGRSSAGMIRPAETPESQMLCGRSERLEEPTEWKKPCDADREKLIAGDIPESYEAVAGPRETPRFFSRLRGLFCSLAPLKETTSPSERKQRRATSEEPPKNDVILAGSTQGQNVGNYIQ